MRGEAAARLVFGTGAFTRHGAMPHAPLAADKGSVQMLEGARHRRRKAMFLRLLTNQIAAIRGRFRRELLAAFDAWRSREKIVLMDELPALLARAALDWVGIARVDLGPDRLSLRLSSMIENAGGFGPRAWLALLRRHRTEIQLRKLVRKHLRADRDDGSLLSEVLRFEDPESGRLSEEEAAVELLNLLRPIVAVGRFVSFAVAALAARPDLLARLRSADDPSLPERFCEEIRRTTPFFPFVGARALRDVDWEEYRIRKGDWVLLDLYSTNRMTRLHQQSERICPALSSSWRDQDFAFIPQGGGDPRQDHRCPGEAFTVALMVEAITSFVAFADWTVVAQAEAVDLSRIPAWPPGGTVLHFGKDINLPS